MGDFTRFNSMLKKWKFTIISTLYNYEIKNTPIGWDDLKLTLTRNQTFPNISRGFSASLIFYHGAFNILTDIEEAGGVNSEAYLLVEKIDTNTGQYVEALNAPFDFVEYKQMSENRRAVSIPLVDSKFIERLTNNKNIEIPYDRETDVFDNEIPAGTYKDITLLGREFGGAGIGAMYKDVTGDDPYNEYDFENQNSNAAIIGVEFDEVETLPNFQDVTKTFTRTTDLTVANCIYYADGVSAQLKINGRINLDTNSNTGQRFLISKATFFEDATIDYDSIVYLINQPFGAGGLNYSFEVEIDLEPSEGIFMQLNKPGTVSPKMYMRSGSKIEINYFSTFHETESKVVLPYEAFDQVITSITGENGSFRSNYFGRTELGYSADGDGAFISLTNGLLLRQFPTGYKKETDEESDDYGDTVAQLAFSLTGLFENFYKLKNIGMQIVVEDGKYIVEVEKKSDLFTKNVVHEFDFIERGSFSRYRDLTYFFNKIEAGYEVPSDDLLGGLEEYNSKIVHSTILEQENAFDLVCSYSGASVSIEKQRRSPYSATSSTELTGDSTVYFVELYNDSGNLVQRNTQGFTDVKGMDGLSNFINLGITPKQMLLAHGWEINTGLAKYPNSKIKFSTSDKTTDLMYLRDGESEYIEEQADIIAGQLDNPIFTGFKVEFTNGLNLIDYLKIQADFNSLIGYTSPITGAVNYGWVDVIGTDPVDTDNNVTLIEANPPDIATIKVLATNENKVVSTSENELIQIP